MHLLDPRDNLAPPHRVWKRDRENSPRSALSAGVVKRMVTAGLWVAILAALLPNCWGAGYVCPRGSPDWPCLKDSNGNPRTIRVQFMEKQFVTVNSAAVAKAAKLGITQSCTNAALALPECFNASNWDGGWLGAFMHKALNEMGVNVVALTTLNASAQAKALYKGASSFTRCVWDVKLGNVDLCVGDFWETPERRNLSVFTTSIDSDSFNMYTRVNPDIEQQFTTQSFLNIFAPFDNSVWLLLAIMFVLNGVAMWLTEAPYGSTDYPKSIGGVIKACYYSSLGFVGGDVPASIWPSRIIAMGFLFFIYIHVNSYVASLASTLVTNTKQLGEVSSMQDLITKGKKLCLYQSMASATQAIIGNIVQRVEMDNYGPMLEKLYQGNCSAAVVGRFESTTFITASNVNFTVCTDDNDPNNFATCANSSIPASNFQLNPSYCSASGCKYASRFCRFVNIYDPTISQITLAWEMPVSKELEPWVSAEMLKLHMEGYLGKAQGDQLLDINPVICPPPTLPSQSLTLMDMSGTYFFGGAFMLLGVFIHLVNLVLYYTVPPWRRLCGGGDGSAAADAAAAAKAAEREAEDKLLEAGEEVKGKTVDQEFEATEQAVDKLLAKVKAMANS